MSRMIVTVTGGTHSGKDRFAEQYADFLGSEGIYIMTHLDAKKSLSTFRWTTKEEPLKLDELLAYIRIQSRSEKAKQRIILVDSLTMWLHNWLLFTEDPKHGVKDQKEFLLAKINQVVEELTHMEHHVIIVTSEAANSNALPMKAGRLYDELVGYMNQQTAKISKQVFLVTAGIPVELKSLAFHVGE